MFVFLEHPLTENAPAGAGFDLVIEGLVVREIHNRVLIPPEEAGEVSEEIAELGWGG